jgi:ankyrin repeat protein
LTNAVTNGDEQAVSALLANGADVNETTGGGQTALILAVIFGRTNLVKLLIKAGADPDQRDNLGLNALEWAQRRGLTEAVAILTNGPQESSPPRRITIPIEGPANVEKPTKRDDDAKETASEAEKSLRWITGFKQRLHEQELRRLNRNEPPPQPPDAVETKPLPLMSAETKKATVAETPRAPEPKREPEPV